MFELGCGLSAASLHANSRSGVVSAQSNEEIVFLSKERG
jgi:hypothetical protein